MPADRTVGLFMWGDLFEDFFDTVGVTFDDFRAELTGGWLFGYVDALATAGVRTVLLYVSARVDAPLRFVHEPTGAVVCVVPSPYRHRIARMLKRRLPRSAALSSLVSYLSLPLGRLARELRAADVDAILMQEYEHPRFDVAVVLGRLLRVPVYATFQGGDAPRSRVETLVRRHAIRACAGLVVAAARERERVGSVYGLSGRRVAAIPNALDVAAVQPIERTQARARLGIPATATVVEWHGRVDVHRKGLDILLAAWEEVCRGDASAERLLLLVGTGRDAAQLRLRIDALTCGRVRWRDEYVNDREELQTYLSAADVYVLPSRHEGFAVAPLEAMAASLPVVATDAPGVADVLGRAGGGTSAGGQEVGLLVPREDPRALAQALTAVMANPSRREAMGRQARRMAEERFSLEAVGAQLRSFLFDPR